MLAVILLSLLWVRSLAYHYNNVAWYGGPVHSECEHGGNPFTGGGQYAEDTRNMIAIKAVSYNNNIYVITPRLRRGVAATVWLVVRGRRGPELDPYPAQRAPHLRTVGGYRTRWISTWIILYISDASRGCILVHDTSSATAWAVAAGAPAAGLQLALARRSPAHPLLVAVAAPRPGIVEIDTAALRRRNSAPRVFGEHAKAMYLLGSDGHRVFLRGTDDANVSSWDVREGYNASRLAHLHAPGRGLLTTSATADPLTHALLVLDSNYADVVHNNATAYQRITFTGIL